MKGKTVTPAFPCQIHNDSSKPIEGFTGETLEPGHVMAYKGMTLRDYFAAKALAAMIGHTEKEPQNCGSQAVARLAAWAYEYADAMLAERAK